MSGSVNKAIQFNSIQLLVRSGCSELRRITDYFVGLSVFNFMDLKSATKIISGDYVQSK